MMLMADTQGNLPQAGRIARVTDENDRVKTFVLDRGIAAAPGQIVGVWLPRIDEKPFSISRANPLTLAIAKVGPFTEKLHALKAGDALYFQGPFGKGFTLPKAGKVLLVGGGYGVAPLRFLAEAARGNGAEVTVVIGAKTASDVILEGAFKELGCKVLISTDDGSREVKGFATDVVSSLFAAERFDAVYACGPERMARKLVDMCLQKGVRCEVSLERHMKCLAGICGQCTVNGLRICKDGPVFDAAVLGKLSEFGSLKRDASGTPLKV